MALVLASQSPRRRELMELVTPHFVTDVAAFDEHAVTAQTPAALAQKLAEGKAAAVHALRGGDVVLGCDTVVEVEGETLGKPENRAHARQMLRLLSGRAHFVHTGVAVYLPGGGSEAAASFTNTTRVVFAPVPTGAIEAYIETQEPYDKAGGYGIQGWAAKYVTRIEGCYYNVMGLPVAALHACLSGLGIL